VIADPLTSVVCGSDDHRKGIIVPDQSKKQQQSQRRAQPAQPESPERQREDFERRMQRQTFNAGEPDQAADDPDADDDIDFDESMDENPTGGNPRKDTQRR
jgi:hypothetical protein